MLSYGDSVFQYFFSDKYCLFQWILYLGLNCKLCFESIPCMCDSQVSQRYKEVEFGDPLSSFFFFLLGFPHSFQCSWFSDFTFLFFKDKKATGFSECVLTPIVYNIQPWAQSREKGSLLVQFPISLLPSECKLPPESICLCPRSSTSAVICIISRLNNYFLQRVLSNRGFSYPEAEATP